MAKRKSTEDLTGKKMFAKGYVLHNGTQYFNVPIEVGQDRDDKGMPVGGMIDNASAQRLVDMGLLISASSDEARELMRAGEEGEEGEDEGEGSRGPHRTVMTPTGPLMAGPAGGATPSTSAAAASGVVNDRTARGSEGNRTR